MVMSPYGNSAGDLNSSTEEDLLDEVARRYNDAPYIFVMIDPQSGFHIHSTIETKMPPKDILKSLAEAIERFAALLDICLSSTGLKKKWRQCTTTVRLGSNYCFRLSALSDRGEVYARDVSEIKIIFNGNSELEALAVVFKRCADFLDHVCQQTKYDAERAE